jgi:hypothetical protein
VPRARTCDDCYFRQKGLCALVRVHPCPTFRDVHAGRMVRKQQASLLLQVEHEPLVAASERELVHA